MLSFLTQWFGFSKSERRGTAVLLSLLAVAFFLPALVRLFHTDMNEKGKLTVENIEFEEPQNGYERRDYNYQKKNYPNASYKKEKGDQQNRQVNLHPFDPNTADAETLMDVGISERVASNIVKYREKGGRFKTKDDFKKIYGISQEQFEQLSPYIQITQAQNQPQQPMAGSFTPTKSTYQPKVISKIDINAADETQWQTLPGIGVSYASRIIKFRNALGGFVDVRQVSETYAMPDSVFRKIEPYLQLSQPNNVRKMNILNATVGELDKHPYLHKGHALDIVKYVERKGKAAKVDELQILSSFDDGKGTYLKIKPYLSAF